MSTSREDYRAALAAMTEDELRLECLARIRTHRQYRGDRDAEALVTMCEAFCLDAGKASLFRESWEAIDRERNDARWENWRHHQSRLKRDEEREQED